MGHRAQGLNPSGLIVQTRDVFKPGATLFQVRIAHFHGNFFQGLQAVAGEARTHHLDVGDTFARQGPDGGFGIRLEPLGFAKPRLKGYSKLVFLQPQGLGQEACGLEALAVVRIPQQQGALRHPVKTHDEHGGLAMTRPVRTHLLRQRLDISGVVVVMVDEPELGHKARALGPGVDSVKHTGGGGRAVLRVGWEDQDAGDTACTQLLHDRRHAGLTITHAITHHHRLLGRVKARLQQLGLGECPHLQGRALGCPNDRVLLRRFGRAHPQNDAVQDNEPKPFGNFNDPGVA